MKIPISLKHIGKINTYVKSENMKHNPMKVLTVHIDDNNVLWIYESGLDRPKRKIRMGKVAEQTKKYVNESTTIK